MSFKDQLSKSRADYSVIKHLFLLNIKAHGTGIHLFFENVNDQSFYGTYIRNMTVDNSNLYTYNCRNKDGVYEVHHKLNYTDFMNEISMFFVDKDLDDIIPIYRGNHPDIYVTSYYSIENFIVTREIIEQIWAEIFKQESNLNSIEIGRKFESNLASFYQLATKIMCWVIYHQKAGNKPFLKNIEMKAFFELTDQFDIQQKIPDSELIGALDSQGKVETTQDDEDGINCIFQEIKEMSPKSFIRGKFEVEFFVEYIKKLRTELNKAPKKPKIHLDITTSNVIDLLAPRVKCPPCLESYLRTKFI